MAGEITREECHENVSNMATQIKNLTDAVHKIEVRIAELPQVLCDKFDKRYANKKTEKTLDKIIWLVIAAVVIGVINLVIK